MAQSPWSASFKLGGGPVMGSVKSLMGDAGMSLGGAFEVAYNLDKGSSLVFDAGFRFYPGDYKTISFIPATATTTAGSYEARVRKPEAKGVELTAMYRVELANDFYVQTGFRLGFNRVTITDTGSQVTYAVVAPATTPSLTAVKTIATVQEKKTTSVGLLGGLGYRLGSAYTLEANVFTLRMSSPLAETKSGLATELTFGVRF